MEKKNGKKKTSTKTTKSVKEEVEVVVEETKPEKEVPKKEVISDTNPTNSKSKIHISIKYYIFNFFIINSFVQAN